MKIVSVAVAVAALGLAAGSIAFASGKQGSPSPETASATTDAKVTIPVEGLGCASCNLTVRRALKHMDGVKKVEPGARENEALVTYDPARVNPEQFVEAIDKLGFKAGTPIKG